MCSAELCSDEIRWSVGGINCLAWGELQQGQKQEGGGRGGTERWEETVFSYLCEDIKTSVRLLSITLDRRTAVSQTGAVISSGALRHFTPSFWQILQELITIAQRPRKKPRILSDKSPPCFSSGIIVHGAAPITGWRAVNIYKQSFLSQTNRTTELITTETETGDARWRLRGAEQHESHNCGSQFRRDNRLNHHVNPACETASDQTVTCSLLKFWFYLLSLIVFELYQ